MMTMKKFLKKKEDIFYVGMTRAKKVLNIIVPGATSLFVMTDSIKQKKYCIA